MDSEWLKTQFRIHPAKSKAGLAAALGLGAPAVSKILAGDRQIKAQEYIRMCAYFGIDSGRGQESLYRLEPLQQQGLHEDAKTEEGDAWMIPASLLKGRTRAQPEDIKIFSIQESAMAPDFSPGEQVLVDLSDKKPSPPGVFVVSDGLGHIVRRCGYIPNSSPPAVKISANDDHYEDFTVPLDRAQIIGRVIAKLEWL